MKTVAVVGLGYVGLPLAVEFGKKFRTIGLDLSQEKIDAYRRHVDPTGEVSTEELKAATLLEPTTDAAALKDADFVVVAVPTPVDEAHIPDFSPLVGASKAVGRNPWCANGLEWMAPSPPGHGNFDFQPVVYRGPYEYGSPESDKDYYPQTEPPKKSDEKA